MLHKCVEVLSVTSDIQVASHMMSLLNTVTQSCAGQYQQWKEEHKEPAEQLITSVREKCQQFKLHTEVCIYVVVIILHVHLLCMGEAIGLDDQPS